jgi:hypothetical protein
MDNLPDELLLMILGHVQDPLTLLDNVPLVCRRWQKLAREPHAWAAVCVEGVFTLDKARVVLHAPHLRRLEVCQVVMFESTFSNLKPHRTESENIFFEPNRIKSSIVMPKTGEMGTFCVVLAQKDSIRNFTFFFRCRVESNQG